jgi:hypothetical protein
MTWASVLEQFMARSSPSALVTDMGRRIHLRLKGRLYELSQDDLRTLLGLPAGPPGLGITIDRDRMRFDFTADHQTAEFVAGQLHRR